MPEPLILPAVSPDVPLEVCAGVSPDKADIDEATNPLTIAIRKKNFFTGHDVGNAVT